MSNGPSPVPPARGAALWSSVRSWVDAERIRHHEDKVLLALTLIIGALVGLVVVAFILVTENLGSRMYPAGGAAWRRLMFPVAGALVSGFLLHRYFEGARGSGIPQTKTALFIHDGVIPMRTVVGKFTCSSISLASGIALGREGPSVQVGAGIASSLGRQLGLGPSTTRALVPIGASAALSAAFNTPIAAVLFTLEEVMGDLHAPVLGSIVLSAATSWIVLHLVLGDEPLFHVPAYQLVHPVELVFYALLGLLGGVASVAFVKLVLWLRLLFRRLPAWSVWLQPAVGGLMVGTLGWFVPAVVGVGYDHVGHALNGQLGLRVMALLVVLKLAATATCYASGNAGGIFGPSLFIGAMLGGAFGGAAHNLVPDYTGGVGAYALVGMGVAFAGIIRVPLTSVIMIFEVTRDYSIIVPLMVSNLISYFVSSRLQRQPIYEALLRQDGIVLPSGARDREALLAVRDAVRPAQGLSASQTAEQSLAAGGDVAAWPVVSTDGRLLGMATRTQLEEAVREGRGPSTLASLLPPPGEPSLTAEDFPHVHADQSLDSAFRRMARSGLTVLPVVSRTNVQELVGTVSMRDALASYGLEGRTGAAPAPRADTRTPVATLWAVLASVVAFVAVAGFLSYFYRSERAGRAERHFQRANTLMEAGRSPEAVEQYRSALSISHRPEHRLALALALAKTGLPEEAEIYLRELVRTDPNNGTANLALARFAAQAGNLGPAIRHYRLAAGGTWPPGAEGNRLAAQIELVDTLRNAGRTGQAQAELLDLASQVPKDDLALQERVGRLMLHHGLPKEAAQVFRKLVRRNPRDADAQSGLAESQFALGNYRAADDAYRAALRVNTGDPALRGRLAVVEQILALDPTMARLRTAERYRRSGEVVEATLRSLERCLSSANGLPTTAGSAVADAARKRLARPGKPRSYGDASEDDVTLASQLWNERLTLCGPPGPDEQAITLVMQRLAR